MDSARGMDVLRRREEMQRQTCLEEDSENACDRGRSDNVLPPLVGALCYSGSGRGIQAVG